LSPDQKISVILPDGSRLSVEKDSSAGDVAKTISEGLFRNSVAAKIDGKLVDLNTKVFDKSKVEILTEKSPEAHEILLHSASHIMAQAVKDLFPEVKVTIGPAIENRFYYDFDIEPPFTESDLEKIENRMNEIISADYPISRKDVSRDDAISIFSEMNEDYKVEIIRDIDNDQNLSIYSQSNFSDLCRGPHVPSTGRIKAIKLLSVAGAYWRGSSDNKMLSRIYGTAFFNKKALKKYLNLIEEAKRRDHRKIGKALDLFEINEQVGPGLVLWHPKGTTLLQTIKEYWVNQHRLNGYELVQSPHIGKSKLWETSGHLGFYRDSMFDSMKVEGDEYFIKPMNCPFHIMIYKSRSRSYKDLPVRYAELGTVYRYEMSGVLHGLMRVRGFTQDDAHIICTPEQLDNEVEKLVQFSFDFLGSFGFKEYEIFISTRPEKKYVGSVEMWDTATESLKTALDKLNVSYRIDEGEGTFYGPKIDMKIKDALGRFWQCTTIQFDFNLSERFDMNYIGTDGEKKRPYMIHRAILGSLERFIGILIEDTVGDFPVWLSPEQAVVIPITSNQNEKSEEFKSLLEKEGIRVKINTKNDTMGAKIREAELEKIPYIYIIGEREAENMTVTIRRRKVKKQKLAAWNEAVDIIKQEIKSKGGVLN